MAKILVVSDDGAGGDELVHRLREGGHNAVSAPDGARAVMMAESEPPDLIVMRLNPAALEGWVTACRVRRAAATRGIRVVALTCGGVATGRQERQALQGCTYPAVRRGAFGDELSSVLNTIESQLALPASGTAAAAAATSFADETPIPVSASAAAGAAVDFPSPATAAATRLLVVDDTPDNRELLSRLFRIAGYPVEALADGPAALRRLREERFDLVLLDVMMPGMDGLEVLREIRRTYAAAQLPVIMVTALDRSEDVVAALNGGANDYVTKPLDFPVVLARVRTHAALKQAVDHVRELERWLAQRNQELQAANVRMRADLDAAGKVQAALLPSSSPAAEGYRFAWLFNPSTELAGDIFNVFRLDDRYLGMYVLDVSGHGVAAALLSVTVSRFLFPVPDPTSLLWERTPDGDCRIAAPARVAERLGERFPFDDATGQYFTVVYGLLDLRQHRLSYVSAGHPAIVRSRPGQPPAVLPGVGFPVGVAAGAEPYEEHVVDLAPGDRLYLYSDGVPETMNPAGETFGTARFLRAIADHGVEGVALDDHLDRVAAAVCQWSGADRCQDDQTILCVERDRG